MDKYKLVIFGNEWDVYMTSYRDLIDNPQVVYIPTFRPNGLRGLVQRIHLNPKLNHIVHMPGKAYWPSYILLDIKPDEQVCFLITERWMLLESGLQLLPYIRQHYRNAKVVCFFQDIINTFIDLYTLKPIDIEGIKAQCDLAISYDRKDAEKHHTAYHPTIFSPLSIQSDNIKYDLYFLGRDKGRMTMLMRLCQEAQRRGLRCKFDMIEIPQEKQIAQEGVFYPKGNIPYEDNLRNSAESRCIIEVLQHEASSPTLRTWEAIALNRKLLTNNSSIKDTDIYDPRYISVFHDETDVDWDFIASESPFQDANPFLETIRPESLVRFIENELNIAIAR